MFYVMEGNVGNVRKYGYFTGKQYGFMENNLVLSCGYCIYVDYVGSLCSSSKGEHKFLFVAIDTFSRFVRYIRVRGIYPKSTCESLLRISCESEIYKRVISDNHKTFKSRHWEETLKLLGAKVLYITRYRSKSNVVETGCKMF